MWASSSDHSYWQRHLDSWIPRLLQLGVQDLTLDMESDSKKAPFSLQPTLFCSKNITNLRLVSCFNIYENDFVNVNMPNLVELTLNVPNWNEEVFKSFVSGCPNLEILDFSFSEGSSSICVLDLPRLRSVRLAGSCFTQVKIVAPMLQIFDLSHGEGKSIPKKTDDDDDDECDCDEDDCDCGYDDDEDGRSIPEVDMIACESTLKVLRLSGLQVTKETLRSHVSKFLKLEELALSKLDLESIEISNDRIRKLEISSCSELEDVEIDASNLEAVTFQQNKYPFYSMDFNSSLKRIDALFFLKRSFVKEFPSWPDTFKKLFLQLRGMKDTELFFSNRKNVIVCEDLDENFLTKMLSDMIKKEEFRIQIMHTRTYEPMLNELFTDLAPSIESISLVSRDHQRHEKFMEVLNRMAVKENSQPNCYEYRHYNCWSYNKYRVEELIHGETTENPSMFMSFDTTEYKITRTKLHWSPWKRIGA